MFYFKKAIAIAVVLGMTVSMTSMAATGTKITSISLKISSDIEAGSSDSDVEVTASSSKYSVEDTEVTNEPDDEWEDGDKPKLKVTLEAEEDYYFPSGFSKSSVSLSGSEGTVSSVSRSGSDSLIVYITLDKLEDGRSVYDLDVSDLEWDESSGTAYWEACKDANKYEVRLYRGSSAVTSVTTTTSDSYDFSGSITTSGTYTFKVRGVYNSSNKGSWEESDSWYVSSEEVEDIYSGSSFSSSPTTSTGPGLSNSSGAWLRDQTGWWYCNADKSYTMNNWQYINEEWYYFDEYGYMETGWILWNSQWYYCEESGVMYVNTITPDGYYVDRNGAWVQ